MQRLFSIALLIICCVPSHAKLDNDSISQPECVNRFEYRHEVKKRLFKGCEELYKDNQYCKRNYTVAYGDFPPYVFFDRHSNKTTGILVGMLESAMESCCFGCNSIEYNGPHQHIERFFMQNASFAMPVQTAKSGEKYFGHDYIHMLSIPSVSFFGAAIKPDPIEIGESLVIAVMDTWPMAILVFVLSISAGFCVWVLDFDWNENEFPLEFPAGPIEGVWWAFISMTTVGYGDKCPRGPLARVFAVFWILAGITMFSMYTASLTSALTSTINHSQNIYLIHKKFGVMNTTSIGMIAAIQVNAKPIPFESLPEIAKAYRNKEIEGIILDDYMANFFIDKLKQYGVDDLTLYHRAMMHGISFGIVSMKKEDKTMVGSFFKSNDDNRELMAELSMQGHDHRQSLKKPTEGVSDFYTASSPMYIITLLVAIGISLVVTIIGLTISYFMKQYRNKGIQDLELLNSRENSLSELMLSMDEMKVKMRSLLNQQNEDSNR